MYAVTADNKTEELLVDASETLASAKKPRAEHCQFVAGVAASCAGGDVQLIMLGELAVNRALDNLQLPG